MGDNSMAPPRPAGCLDWRDRRLRLAGPARLVAFGPTGNWRLQCGRMAWRCRRQPRHKASPHSPWFSPRLVEIRPFGRRPCIASDSAHSGVPRPAPLLPSFLATATAQCRSSGTEKAAMRCADSLTLAHSRGLRGLTTQTATAVPISSLLRPMLSAPGKPPALVSLTPPAPHT
jgi:hypothetical protein